MRTFIKQFRERFSLASMKQWFLNGKDNKCNCTQNGDKTSFMKDAAARKGTAVSESAVIKEAAALSELEVVKESSLVNGPAVIKEAAKVNEPVRIKEPAEVEQPVAVSGSTEAKLKLSKKRKPDRNRTVRMAMKMDKVTNEIHSNLNSRFELRFNVITEQTEYRPIGGRLDQFEPVDQRAVNTWCIELRNCGVDCWDRDLIRYLNSQFIEMYHPFRMYMDELPAWDGMDRLKDLAGRVSTSECWVNYFHRWMLGMTAQWMGMEQLHANSVAPLLISQQQGWMKSTFCKSLMPQSLQAYYTDQLNLTRATSEMQLSLMGLINLDEFDRISPKKMAQLKNLMQLSSLTIRKAYKKNYQHLPRVASFIGTSNRKDLLTDPTGSRRFICVEVEGPINCKGLDMTQIYAQLKAELANGQRYWFTQEEEQEIQEHNKQFYRLIPEEEIFRAHFRLPKVAESFQLLSLVQIIEVLREHHKGMMSSVNLNQFGVALVAAGVERVHTRDGNRYKVVCCD